MRRIAVINQKGGVGKTTTTANLGAALAEQGRRVVLVDMDAQANLSLSLGVEAPSGSPTSYTVLVGESTFAEALRPTSIPNLSLLPSNLDLSGAELELASQIGREFLLRDALQAWEAAERKQHGRAPADYVLFDCPPSLGLLAINALAASGEVLITLQTEFLALQGMSKLVEVVQLLRKRLNPDLVITGILPCLYESRVRLAREVLGEIKKYFPGQVFPVPVRNNVKLAEAPSFGQTIFEYAPDSIGATDYRCAAREVLRMEARDKDLVGLPAFRAEVLAGTNHAELPPAAPRAPRAAPPKPRSEPAPSTDVERTPATAPQAADSAPATAAKPPATAGAPEAKVRPSASVSEARASSSAPAFEAARAPSAPEAKSRPAPETNPAKPTSALKSGPTRAEAARARTELAPKPHADAPKPVEAAGTPSREPSAAKPSAAGPSPKPSAGAAASRPNGDVPQTLPPPAASTPTHTPTERELPHAKPEERPSAPSAALERKARKALSRAERAPTGAPEAAASSAGPTARAVNAPKDESKSTAKSGAPKDAPTSAPASSNLAPAGAPKDDAKLTTKPVATARVEPGAAPAETKSENAPASKDELTPAPRRGRPPGTAPVPPTPAKATTPNNAPTKTSAAPKPVETESTQPAADANSKKAAKPAASNSTAGAPRKSAGTNARANGGDDPKHDAPSKPGTKSARARGGAPVAAREIAARDEASQRVLRADDLPPLPPDAFEILSHFDLDS